MEATPILLLSLVSVAVILLAWQRLRLRRAFFALRRQIVWSIRHAPRDKFVLEVGSGHNPHIRSDVLCEKYLSDDAHRAAGVVVDRPLVVGDANALPFKTRIFDVIISSHMIEHLDDPRPFFQEAGRVAHSGLFTAPSAIRERLMSELAHRWLIEQEGDKLLFAPKSQTIYDPAIHQFFGNKVVNSILKFDHFMLDHWEALEITYSWNEQPQCTIDGEPDVSNFVNASTVEATVRRNPTGIERLRSFLRTWVRSIVHTLLSSSRGVVWAEILACPQCHGDIQVSTSNIYCPACGLRFPVDRGIPIMLLDHAMVDSHLAPIASVDAQ